MIESLPVPEVKGVIIDKTTCKPQATTTCDTLRSGRFDNASGTSHDAADPFNRASLKIDYDIILDSSFPARSTELAECILHWWLCAVLTSAVASWVSFH
jgi:hypothetical protein